MLLATILCFWTISIDCGEKKNINTGEIVEIGVSLPHDTSLWEGME